MDKKCAVARQPCRSEMNQPLLAIDLFAGCGGLTAGLKRAGFEIVSAVEIDDLAASTYKANHFEVRVIQDDIRNVMPQNLVKEGETVDLIAGCPPCQGFSRLRRHNRQDAAEDERNNLISEFTRMVEGLKPKAVFMENVPGIENDARFVEFLESLRHLGYVPNWESLELADYGVPQWRTRVVVLAGKGFEIPMPRRSWKRRTVRKVIGSLPLPADSRDPSHNETTKHKPATLKRIRAVPRDGGSRRSWSGKLALECHRDFDGFKDVYGRMWWDAPAPTITGGCINASKGRFLHPEQDRAITVLEAALLQTFDKRYYFNGEQGRYAVAEMIGNALPPGFAERVGCSISRVLKKMAHGGRIRAGCS